MDFPFPKNFTKRDVGTKWHLVFHMLHFRLLDIQVKISRTPLDVQLWLSGEGSRLKIEMILKMKRLHEIIRGVSADRKQASSKGFSLGSTYV